MSVLLRSGESEEIAKGVIQGIVEWLFELYSNFVFGNGKEYPFWKPRFRIVEELRGVF